MGRIPATARLGLILSAVTLLPVMIWRREPGLVLNDTLPRMRSPANAIRLIDGVPNLAWTREMTPFRAAQPAGLPWDSPDPARIATLSGVDDPWRRDLEIRRFVDIEVGLRLLPSGRRGPSEQSSRLLGILDEAARAHPDNAYFPLVAAAVSRRIGDEAAAADLLRMASGLKVYDAGEKFVAAMLTAETPRRGGHGKSPSVVAQRIGDYGVVADLPHNVWVRFMLQRSGFQGDPATRLAAMKCAALARVGSTTIDRALEWATIETQIASASPTLAPALAASLPAGAKWVNKEMPRALEWRRKLEALRGMHPDWSASYLRLGLLWRQVTGLTVSCLLLFVFGLAAYVFGAPVVRGKSSPWLPLAGAFGLAVLFYATTPETRVATPADLDALARLPIGSSRLMALAITAPLCVVAGALLASFKGVWRSDARTGQFARFTALARDASFLALPCLALLLLWRSNAAASLEESAADAIADALRGGEPARAVASSKAP